MFRCIYIHICTKFIIVQGRKENLRCKGTHPYFTAIFKKENNFVDFLSTLLSNEALQNEANFNGKNLLLWSTVKEKNLLLEKQILSFKN